MKKVQLQEAHQYQDNRGCTYRRNNTTNWVAQLLNCKRYGLAREDKVFCGGCS